LEAGAFVLKGGGGGGCEWDDPSGEFAIEGDGAVIEADEGIDVAEISAGEFGAVENEGVGGGKSFGEGVLAGGVGFPGEKHGGEFVELGGAWGGGEEAIEAGEENDGEGGASSLETGCGGEVARGVGKCDGCLRGVCWGCGFFIGQ
jgi:hypothetical protein